MAEKAAELAKVAKKYLDKKADEIVDWTRPAYVSQLGGLQQQQNLGIQYTGGGLSNAQYSNAAEVLASQPHMAAGIFSGHNKGQ